MRTFPHCAAFSTIRPGFVESCPLRTEGAYFFAGWCYTVREGMRANIGCQAAALQNAITPPPDSGKSEERVDEESLDAALAFVDSL